MAKIVFSSLVSAIRGKIGGTIFQGGRYGFIARQNFYPFNPSTEKQKKARGRLGSISKEWKDLTPSQRATWSVSVNERTQQPKRKKVFTVNVLSPFAFFLQTNSYRSLVKLTQIYEYRGTGAKYAGQGVLLKYDKNNANYYLSFTSPVVANTFVLMYSTVPFSSGVSNFGGHFVYSGFFQVISPQSQYNVDLFWQKQFTGTLTDKQQIGFKTVFVSENGVYTSENNVKVEIAG